MDLTLWKNTKKQRGMTYKDISKISGIPLGTIKNIFAGYTPDPRESTIKAIEMALGVETRIIHSEFSKKDKYPKLNSEEKQLLQNFRSLDRPERAQAAEYVQYLADKRGNKNKHA